MSTVTVTHAVLDESENPVAHCYVEIAPLGPQNSSEIIYNYEGGYQVIGTVRLYTDTAGEFETELIPNAQLSPTGTRYEVTIVAPGHAGSSSIIEVPDDATPQDSYALLDMLSDAPDELATGALSAHLADTNPHAGHLGGGSGAPTDAPYLVTSANGSLSAEVVVGTTPGGELGGTWGSPTVDSVHAGSSHSQVQTAAESTAATALAGHVSASDPHAQYLKESEYQAGSSLPTGDTTGDVLYWNQDQATPGAVWDAGIGDFGLSYAWAHVGLYLGEWAAGEYGAGSVVFKAATGELYFAQGTTTAGLNNSIWQHHDGTTPIIFHVEQGVTFPEVDPTRPVACQGSLALVDGGDDGAQLWQMSGSEWLQFANGDVNLTPWRINADGYFVSDGTNVSINVPDSNGVLAVGMLAEDLGTTGAYFLMYGRNSGVRAGNAYATLDSRDRNAGFIITAYNGSNTDVWKFQADGTLQIFSSVAEEGDVLTAGTAGVVQWSAPTGGTDLTTADFRTTGDGSLGTTPATPGVGFGVEVGGNNNAHFEVTSPVGGVAYADFSVVEVDAKARIGWWDTPGEFRIELAGHTLKFSGAGVLSIDDSQIYPQARPTVYTVVDDDVDNIPVNYWDGVSDDITIIVTAFTNNRGVVLPEPNTTDFADGTKITFKVDASCSDVNYFQIIPDAATTLDGTTNPYSIAFPLGAVTAVIDQASNAWWFVAQYAPTP